MDGPTEPTREVHVAQFALLLDVLVLNELFKVIKIQIGFVTKVFKNVFYSDESIVVCVQREECLSDRFEAVAELGLQSYLQL